MVSNIVKIVALTAIGCVLFVSVSAAGECPESAQRFWKVFRQMVLKKDDRAIVAKTRFPFQIKGTLDSSGVRQVRKAEFSSTIPTLLATDPGLSPEPSTMEKLIKKTAKLPPNACDASGNEFRIGTWVFQNSSNRWQFVRGYVEE
jgi:hypothetical protein